MLGTELGRPMFFLRTKQVSFTWMARSTTRHLWRTTGPPLRGSDSICVDEHLLSFTLFHADLVTCAGRVSRGRQLGLDFTVSTTMFYVARIKIKEQSLKNSCYEIFFGLSQVLVAVFLGRIHLH